MNTKETKKETNKITNPALGPAERGLIAFASTDASRYVLNSVHWHAEKNRWEATDGRRLCIIPGSQADEALTGANPEALASVILPTSAIKQAQKTAPRNRNHPNLDQVQAIKAAKNDHGTVRSLEITGLAIGEGERKLSSPVVDGVYPNCEQVIPKDKGKVKASFSAKYLRDLADYACKVGVSGRDTAIKIELNDEFSPMTATFHTQDKRKVLHVLMPMRMS